MRLSISKRKSYGAIIGLMLLLSTLLGCSIVSSNSTPVVDGEIDTSRYVKLSMFLIGPPSVEEIMGYQDTVERLNNNLKEKINANVEITFIPFDEMDRSYPLLFHSKESFDIAYTSTKGKPSYFGLAAQDILKAIDELLPIYAKEAWENVSPHRWDDTKYNGKIYGIPFGNDEYRANGYIYRGDLLQKYGMEPILSIEGIENYIDTLRKEEPDTIPIDMNEDGAIKLYDMLVDANTAWISAPGIPQFSLYLVSTSKDNLSDILHPAFSNEFMEFAVKMKAWAEKGYWREDILTRNSYAMSDLDAKISASSFGDLNVYINGSTEFPSPVSWTEGQLKFFCFGEDNQKIIKSSAAKDALGISANSNNAERALMLLDLIIQDKEAYGLLNYGVEGEIPKYIEPSQILEHYESISIKDPYARFAFDFTSIEDEIEDILRINSQYGIPILLGKGGDPMVAVEQYREELKAAGIDKVIDALKEQLKDS